MKLAQIVARVKEHPLVGELLLIVVRRVAHEQAHVGAVGQLLDLAQKYVFADEKMLLDFEQVHLGVQLDRGPLLVDLHEAVIVDAQVLWLPFLLENATER